MDSTAGFIATVSLGITTFVLLCATMVILVVSAFPQG
jgi:hypothetical protein